MKRKITKFTIFGLSLNWTKKALVIGSFVFFLLEFLGILLELGLDAFFDLGQFSPADIASTFLKWVIMLFVFFIVDIYAMIRVKRGYSYVYSENCEICNASGWVTKSKSRDIGERFYVCPICNGIGEMFFIMETHNVRAQNIIVNEEEIAEIIGVKLSLNPLYFKDELESMQFNEN